MAIYSYNNEAYKFDPTAPSRMRKFDSWDQARVDMAGEEEVGLSNDDWANIQSGGAPPGGQAAPKPQAPAPQQNQQSGGAPPPPPPLPNGGFPAPMPIAPPAPAPDFAKLASMSPAQMGQSYTPSGTSSLMLDSQLMQALDKFALEGLQTPSRWDQALVKDSLGVIDDSVARNRADGQRGLAETLAARGLFNGNGEPNSIAWDEGYSLEDRLDENERAAKNELAQRMAGDFAADRQAAGGVALGVGGFKQGLGRDVESDKQFTASFNRTVGRDFEDDLRARTGFQIQGGSLTDDALMARALFGMQANNQTFNQGMAGAQFGEAQRQFNASFGENQRQFNADFGLRDYLGRAGIDLDNRRVSEGIRQFDVMSEQEKSQFAASLGLNKQQLEEQIRHNKQLETVALMDYLERTNSDFSVGDDGTITPGGSKPTPGDNPADDETPPLAALTFEKGKYGSPPNPQQGHVWKDPSGGIWKWDGTKWKRDINYAN